MDVYVRTASGVSRVGTCSINAAPAIKAAGHCFEVQRNGQHLRREVVTHPSVGGGSEFFVVLAEGQTGSGLPGWRPA